jgi:hypothetical protein
MTTRKGTVPKGATLSSEQNQWFEALALREIERLATRSWGDMDALWRQLPLAHPSTQRRILARCFELASKRGDDISAKLVKRIAPHVVRALAVSRIARATVRDEEAFRKATFHFAHNPKASFRQLAKAAGAKVGTIRQWIKRPEFQADVKDEQYRKELARLRRHAALHTKLDTFAPTSPTQAELEDWRSARRAPKTVRPKKKRRTAVSPS